MYFLLFKINNIFTNRWGVFANRWGVGLNSISSYNSNLVNKASANEKQMDVGANLFVGNLAAEVDEKLLFDTFSAFGVILQVFLTLMTIKKIIVIAT
jgi:RNA recognition motif-containing protein